MSLCCGETRLFLPFAHKKTAGRNARPQQIRNL